MTIVAHPAPRTPPGERCDGTDDDVILPSATAAAITENAGQAATDPASVEPSWQPLQRPIGRIAPNIAEPAQKQTVIADHGPLHPRGERAGSAPEAGVVDIANELHGSRGGLVIVAAQISFLELAVTVLPAQSVCRPHGLSRAHHHPSIPSNLEDHIRRATKQSRGFREKMRIIDYSNVVPGEMLSENMRHQRQAEPEDRQRDRTRQLKSRSHL
jgi:hypothetical protein